MDRVQKNNETKKRTRKEEKGEKNKKRQKLIRRQTLMSLNRFFFEAKALHPQMRLIISKTKISVLQKTIGFYFKLGSFKSFRQ